MNHMMCLSEGNPSHCNEIGKVESALHSAIYPGQEPFVPGGVVGIAGAMPFYLTKAHAFRDGNKRTAVIAATTFLAMNGLSLKYPSNRARNENAFSEALEKTAAGEMSKAKLIAWFENQIILRF